MAPFLPQGRQRQQVMPGLHRPGPRHRRLPGWSARPSWCSWPSPRWPRLLAKPPCCASAQAVGRHLLTDGSAVVTAWLIASPSRRSPVVAGRHRHRLAIVVAKHLYGGLGQNPSTRRWRLLPDDRRLPALMSQWPRRTTRFLEQSNSSSDLAPRVDASPAPRRSTLKTALKLAPTRRLSPLRPWPIWTANFAGRGGEWVAAGYLLGGLWLIQRKLITWLIPVAFLAPFAAPGGAVGLRPGQFASRCSTCQRRRRCSAPSSSSPIPVPAAPRRAAS